MPNHPGGLLAEEVGLDGLTEHAADRCRPLVPRFLSTRPLNGPMQWPAWAEWFQPVFDVHAELATEPGFPAEYAAWQLDGLAYTTAVAPAARSVRWSHHIRRSPVDHWVISYSSDSETRILSGGRTAVASPGTPLIWSLGQASDSLRMAGNRQQLYLPRDSFADLADRLDAAVVSTIDTPLGSVLGDLMVSLQCRLPTITVEHAPALSAAIRAMIVACVAPKAAGVAAIEKCRLHRLRGIVRENLGSPELGPAMLCRQLAISRSVLYRLLDPYGGATRFIQRARLRAARQDLRDPANRMPIARMAEGFCFSDASAFARAYRREFGHSPKDARDAARHGSWRQSVPSPGDRAPGRYSDALNL